MKNTIKNAVANKNTTVKQLTEIAKACHVKISKSMKRADIIKALTEYADSLSKQFDIKTTDATYNTHVSYNGKTVAHIYKPTKRQPKYKVYFHLLIADACNSTDAVEIFTNENYTKRPATEKFSKYAYFSSEADVLEYVNDALNILASKTEA